MAKTKRVKTVLTTKQQRLWEYAKIISGNKKTFSTGSVISRQDLVNILGLENITNKGNAKNIMRSNLALVDAQVVLNTILRESGLYIKSKDYYSEFHVACVEQTKDAIARYSSEVDTNRDCTDRLEATLKQQRAAGTWGKPVKLLKAQVITLGQTIQSKRHTSKLKRLVTV